MEAQNKYICLRDTNLVFSSLEPQKNADVLTVTTQLHSMDLNPEADLGNVLQRTSRYKAFLEEVGNARGWAYAVCFYKPWWFLCPVWFSLCGAVRGEPWPSEHCGHSTFDILRVLWKIAFHFLNKLKHSVNLSHFLERVCLPLREWMGGMSVFPSPAGGEACLHLRLL